MNLRLTNKQLYPQQLKEQLKEKVYKVGDVLTFFKEDCSNPHFNGSRWMLVFNWYTSEIFLVGLDIEVGVVLSRESFKGVSRYMEITENMIAKHFGVEFLEV